MTSTYYLYSLTISAILFCSIKNIKCQEFAPNGAIWHFTYIESFFNESIGFEQIEVVNDTLINGKFIKILKQTLNPPSKLEPVIRYEYLYENNDTIFRLSDDGKLYVLYNFNAEVGDQWLSKTYSYTYEEEIEYVVSVDSIYPITINGIDALEMRYSTDDELNFYVDGIVNSIYGGYSYLFPEDYRLRDFDIRFGIRCYSDSIVGNIEFFNQENYNFPSVTSCVDIIVNSFDNQIEDSIEIFPNPCSGYLNINLSKDIPVSSDITYQIYNSNGTMIKNGQLDFKNQIEIFDQGIYFLNIRLDQKLLNRKIVSFK